jgi:hypothetical protein
MGTAVTTIQTFDPLTGAFSQPQAFTTNSEVIFDDPLIAGQVVEDNPFNLTIQSPSQGGLPAPGTVSFLSAGSLSTSSGAFLANYWDIDIVNQGNGVVEFQGVLQEDFVEQAAAINSLDLPETIAPGIAPITFPATMAEGTQISGAFSQTEFQATIQGNTLQGDAFVVEVNDVLV